MLNVIHTLLVGMHRPVKQVLLICVDSGLLFFAVWAAYSIKNGQPLIPSDAQWLLMASAPLIAFPIFVRMGLYRAVIRYLSEHVLWTILRSMSLAVVLWAALAFISQEASHEVLPRTVILLYWLFGILFVAGVRFTARWLMWLPLQRRYLGHQALIYGAGEAGRQIVATLREGRDVYPAGFLDDDESLQGKDLNGLRVYPPRKLPSLINHLAVQEVIVAMPSISSARRREIVEFLERHPVRVRLLTEVSEIATGRSLVNRIREVDIGDLLGRDVVVPDQKLLGQSVTKRNVMVTGAGGSIGSELCRQITALNPKKILLLEQSEFALYQIERRLRNVAECEVIGCLGSVNDSIMISALLAEHQIQTVYHAAAYKHVPIVEGNVLEGCRNNVLGTLSVARAAFDAGVETFVFVSTDKAVRPTNVMGGTKRWAEMITQSLALEARLAGKNQRFCAVRFGNVLGSSGSVIPLFKEQIAQGGPVTVTHSEVTRYFMSIHEAVQLVIQSSNLAQGGEIFLLDMGAPVKIAELASNMVRLSGRTLRNAKQPDGDIEIVYTGLRPGEKLYEELLIASGNAEGTSHPKIMKVVEPTMSWEALQVELSKLKNLLQARDATGVRELLMQRALGVAEPSQPMAPSQTYASGQVVPLPLNRASGR